MKKIQKMTWVFLALVLTTATTLVAQNQRNVNQYSQNQYRSCVDYISELSDKQKADILEMENKHQEEIAVLRNERRATYDLAGKDAIRKNMDEKVAAHRTAVKELLNADQQKQYDELQAAGPYYKNRIVNQNYGRGRAGYAAGGRGYNRGAVPCRGNVRAAGYGQGRGRNAVSYGRGAGRGAAGYGRGQAVNSGRGYGRNVPAGRGYGRGYGYGYPVQQDTTINN
ncbi:MAG: hypothetical protein ABFS16_06560 [Bacteroidota bacterium]